ncbi:MAG: DUF5663 domain-containing protein [Gordonia sp. (in: high G+C Gram-positive bacteria)]
MNDNLPDPSMAAALVMMLPGLGSADLADLAGRAYVQLEERVGIRLSEGLSDEQLADFEKLIDAGADDDAGEWLATHLPGYHAVVAIERARLLAEIVTTLAEDVTLTRGRRDFAEMLWPTLELLQDTLTEQGATCFDDDEILIVPVRTDDLRVDVVWRLSDDGPRRLIARGMQTVTDAGRATDLAALRDRWNAQCPAVTLRIQNAGDELVVWIEGGVPVEGPMSPEQLHRAARCVHRAMAQAAERVAEVGGGGSTPAAATPTTSTPTA